MDQVEQKEVSQKSTKKQLWEAYQMVLQSAAKKHGESMPSGSSGDSLHTQEETKIAEQMSILSFQKVMGDIGQLKMSSAEMLNGLGDKIAEELKTLESVNKAIALKNERLKNTYNIEAEAVNLFDLIEAKEKERMVLQNNFEMEKEKLEREISQTKKQHERADEEYQYSLKVERQKEQDENDFKNKVKERDFNEKLSAKQKELSLKESRIVEQENEMKEIKLRFEKLPEEIETAKNQAHTVGKDETATQAKIEKELLAKDYSRDQEIAKLKIDSLEAIVKKQGAQIEGLESQLSLALQKAQELAVKIIESGKQEKDLQNSIQTNK